MDSHAGAILGAAWAAFQLYLRNRSLSLCFEYGRDDIEGGSGVCVEIAGRLFVATAAHNFARLAPGVVWSALSANRSSNHPLNVLQANHRVGIGNNEPDVAWLEIDPQSAKDSDLVAVPLQDVLLYPTLYPGEVYFATGFPVSLKQVSEAEGHREITLPFGIYGTTAVNDAVASNAGEQSYWNIQNRELTSMETKSKLNLMD